ncbi:hypothetical protein MIND_01167200 [Mycena indigotica]|uniref:Uncharacterized protein n=1 Tax=Mycena indigotica TaxID=2126181 RepID=A0A8H6S7E3_9AGAR|nr:uncharacterized protein MIND_01167200 [Mycena indigotica]KAF7292690.1 hypothetical protein MIND_01167200 [Mycena indigotica]
MVELIPHLPEDLERAIFEHTAITDPGTVLPLMLVARRVHVWVEPLLFRILRVTERRRHQAALRALKRKPSAFAAQHVGHLLVDGISDNPSEVLTELLKRCTGLHGLGTTYRYHVAALLPLLADLRLRRLTADLGEIWRTGHATDTPTPIDTAHLAFAHVTHLNLHDQVKFAAVRAPVCAALPRFPALTHVRLQLSGSPAPITEFEAALHRAPHLHVLVLGEPDAADVAALGPAADVRLVCVSGGCEYAMFWKDWEDGLRGRLDVWERAERFVEGKREGRFSGLWLPNQ